MLQLDQEVDGLQQTVYVLQNQVNAHKEREAKLQIPSSSGNERPGASEHGAGDDESATTGGDQVSGGDVESSAVNKVNEVSGVSGVSKVSGVSGVSV